MAQRQDLIWDQGSKLQWVYEVNGLSLAGMQARMQVRSVSRVDLYADVSNYLTVDALNNFVTIDVPSNVSTSMTWDRGVYDIEVYLPAQPTESAIRIVQGDIALDREVTV